MKNQVDGKTFYQSTPIVFMLCHTIRAGKFPWCEENGQDDSYCIRMEMCGAIFGGKDYKFTELKKKNLKKNLFQ